MKIITSFDDGCILDMRVAELLTKYNLPGIFYIPAYWESYATYKGWKPLSKENVLELSNNFEIGSHGITHDLLTRVPTAVAEYEVTHSKTLLEQLIQKPVDSFCYPRGYTNKHITELVRNVYKTGRTTTVNSLDGGSDPAMQATSIHVACQRQEYGLQDWLEWSLALVKKAKWGNRKNCILHIWGHSHEIDKNDAWKSFEYLLAEVVS